MSVKTTPSLSISQVRSILENEPVSVDKDLLFYREFFFFGCFTALSVINMISLSKQMLFPLNGDRLKLDASRIKINMQEKIIHVLVKLALKIISEYCNLNFRDSSKVFQSFLLQKLRIATAKGKYFRFSVKMQKIKGNFY